MTYWVINEDPDTGRPLEIALANDRDQRVCFLTSDGHRTTASLIAAAPDLAAALAALVKTFHARPDILQLCGFQEHGQLQDACNALNRAGCLMVGVPK